VKKSIVLAALLLAAGARADEGVDALNKRMMQLYTDGYYEQAIPLAAQIVTQLEQSAGPGSAAVASAVNNEAELYNKLHRFPEAEALYKRSLAIRQAVLGPDHPDTQKSLARLAEVFHAEGKDVLPPQQQAQQRPQPVPQPRPVQQPPQPRGPSISQQEFQHAIEMNKQSLQLGADGRYAEAIPLGVQALAIFEKAFGAENPNVAVGCANLAQLYVQAGQFDKAEPLYKRAAAILEKHPDRQKDFSFMLAGLADLYTRQKRYPEAETYYRRAIPALDKALGPDDATSVAIVNNFANIERAQNKDPDKEAVLKGRWEKTAQFSLPRSRNFGSISEAPLDKGKDINPADLEQSRDLDTQIATLTGQKKYAEALPLVQDQQALVERMYGKDSLAAAMNLDQLASIYRNLGRGAEAEPLAKRSQAIRDASKAIEQISR